MMMVVVMSAVLARLSRNGIFAVRMIWMMSVWVSRDSTNQPVWNSAGFASREDLFDGSFADENVGVVISLKNDRHPAPLEVEWNFVDLAEPFVDLQLLVEFDMFEDCDIEQVLET